MASSFFVYICAYFLCLYLCLFSTFLHYLTFCSVFLFFVQSQNPCLCPHTRSKRTILISSSLSKEEIACNCTRALWFFCHSRFPIPSCWIPNLSHVDQLTFIFRFISKQSKTLLHCLSPEPVQSHAGQSLAAMVDSLGPVLSNCTGQSFDNGSNMSGWYSGLQAHLKQGNPLIHYMPCASFSKLRRYKQHRGQQSRGGTVFWYTAIIVRIQLCI